MENRWAKIHLLLCITEISLNSLLIFCAIIKIIFWPKLLFRNISLSPVVTCVHLLAVLVHAISRSKK